MVAGERNLRGTRQVQVIGRQVVDLFGVLVEESSTTHDLRGHQGRSHHRHETVGDGLVHGHGHESEFEACAHTLEVVEASTRHLRTALGVDRIQALTQCQVILGLKTFACEITRRGALVAQDNEVFLAADGNAIKDQVREQAGQAIGLGIGSVRGGLGCLHFLSELFCLRKNSGAFFLGCATHRLGHLFLRCTQGFKVLEGLATGNVGFKNLVNKGGISSASAL